MVILQALILLVLLIIAFQDLKSRLVSWVCFPALVVLFVVLRYYQQASGANMDIVVNLGFVIVQLLLVSVYFSVKHKRFINITNELLGWGDVLFLLSACFYLSVLNYVLFYMISLVIILVSWLLRNAIVKKESGIPLAGLQALLLGVMLVYDWFNAGINFTMDNWLIV